MRGLSGRLLTVVMAALCLASTAAFGELFSFNYVDVTIGTGNGFDDATEGAARRSTLEAAGAYLETLLDVPGAIEVNVQESQTDGSGFLGSAGTYYSNNSSVFQNGVAFQHATTGVSIVANDCISRNYRI